MKIIILEDFFPTLPLCGKAGDGPHLDLHPRVELLPPHVPHPMAGRGHSAVLEQHHSLTTCTFDCGGKHSHSYCSYNSCLNRQEHSVKLRTRVKTQTHLFSLHPPKGVLPTILKLGKPIQLQNSVIQVR